MGLILSENPGTTQVYYHWNYYYITFFGDVIRYFGVDSTIFGTVTILPGLEYNLIDKYDQLDGS